MLSLRPVPRVRTLRCDVPRVKVRRILLVHLGCFGDAVMATAVPRELRERLPNAEIVWLTTREAAELVHSHPAVDSLVVPRGGRAGALMAALRLRRARADVAIDLEGSTLSGLVTWLSGAGIRLGHGDPGKISSLFLTHTVRPQSTYVRASERSLEVLNLLNLTPASFEPLLSIDAWDLEAAALMLREAGLPSDAQFVAIGPGTSHPRDRWRARFWSTVVDSLHYKYGLASVLLGSPQHTPLLRTIAERCGAPTVVLGGRTTLPQAAAVIKASRLFIGVDSGLVSLAVATKTPAVVVAGWPPRRTLPEERVTVVSPRLPWHRGVHFDRWTIDHLRPRHVVHTADGWLSNSTPWARK